jgi:hypothetical protein
MIDGELLERSKQEFKQRLDGERYECLIPDDTNPPEN